MAWPFGAMALLRGLAGASGAGSMAVQALLQLLPTATSGESAATSVATASGFHQRAGASTSTPITNLILAGRIPGREQLSESDQKEKVGRQKGEDMDKKENKADEDETDGIKHWRRQGGLRLRVRKPTGSSTATTSRH